MTLRAVCHPLFRLCRIVIAYASSAAGWQDEALVSYEPVEFSLMGKRLSAQTSLQTEKKRLTQGCDHNILQAICLAEQPPESPKRDWSSDIRTSRYNILAEESHWQKKSCS